MRPWEPRPFKAASVISAGVSQQVRHGFERLQSGEFEEVPGVTVLLQTAFASGVGIEARTLVPDDDGNWDHVPNFLRNDVGDEEINFVEAIIRGESAALDPVTRFGKALRGFDLNSPHEGPVTEDEVVAAAVSPGPGHAETKTDGLEHENQFRDFTFALPSRALEPGEVE